MGGFNTGLGGGGGEFKAGTGKGFDTGLGGGGVKSGVRSGGFRLSPGGASRGPQRKPSKSAIGGKLDWLTGKLALAGHDLAAMPGGIFQIGKAGVHDAAKLANREHIGSSYTRREGRGKYELPAIGRGIAHSTVQSLEHPLRDPFLTGLNVAPIAGVAGKIGEAGIAARAADAAAGESRIGEAAKALVRSHGEQAPRVLKSGGRVVQKDGVTMRIGGLRETNLIPARNAAWRLGQRAYDRRVQAAMDKQAQAEGVSRLTERIAEHGKKRIGGALAEEQRASQRISQIPADRLERSALKLSKLPLKAGGKIHSAAEELVATQTHPDAAAVYHEGQAAKFAEQARTGLDENGNPLPKADRKAALEAARNNKGVAKLYRKVSQNDLIHQTDNGLVINPEKSRLAAADAAYQHAGNEGERIIQEHNLMSPEGQQERINAPAQVRAGAEYVKPTPGKLGVESPVLKEARSQLDKAEKLFAKVKLRAMSKVNMRNSVMNEFASREMTHAEAEARLAELDKQHEDLANKLVPHVSPYGGKDSKIEQLRRNEINGKIKKGKTVRGASRQTETVKEEELRLADEKMRELASKHAGTDKPWADQLQNLLNERDKLRSALQSHADAPIFGHTPEPLPHVAGNGYKYELPWMRDPEVQRFAGHVSILKDKVQKLEAAHEGRIQETGLVGGENALPGRSFVPYRSSEKTGKPAVLTAAQRNTIGDVSSPLDKKAFTGENIRQGRVPRNVFFSMAKHYRQLAKFENTLKMRDAILKADGSPLKRSGSDILIRVHGQDAKPLTEEMKQALGEAHTALHDHVSLDEINAGTEMGLSALHQFLNQHILDREAASRAEAIGTRAPDGYQWVSGHLAEQLQRDAAPAARGPRTLPGKYMDNVNSLITAMTVYFKLGHVFTRALTNAATNIMQGSARPDEALKSYLLWKSLSDDEKARALSSAGQQGFAALPHEGSEGLAGKAVSGLARGGSRFWAKHFDAPFRFNSLAYELRKAGYSTPEEFRSALDAIAKNGKGMPAHEWSKVSAAFRRADREAISYDRLNEFEKRYLARAIWFYPWVKGSAVFTVRSILEHPWKMAALGAASKVGEKAQAKNLGPVPSYEQGLVPLTGGHSPLTADFSTFSPMATLGQLANIPNTPGGLAQQFNPVLGSGLQYAQGVNQYGEPSNNPLGDALSSLVAPTPEAQIADAIRRSKKGSGKRMFPGMDWEAELKRYGLGPGLAFRRVNRHALAKAAHREHAKRYTVYGK